MTTFTPQKAYLLIGLALISQYLVAALASNLVFMPYADPEKLQDLVKLISPTGIYQNKKCVHYHANAFYL